MKYICVDAEELQIMQRTDCSHINYSDVISKYRVIVCFYLVLGGRYSIRMSLKTPQRVIVTPHSLNRTLQVQLYLIQKTNISRQNRNQNREGLHFRATSSGQESLLRNVCPHARDKTTINFQYIYHIAFWLLENSTTLRDPNKCQIQID